MVIVHTGQFQAMVMDFVLAIMAMDTGHIGCQHHITITGINPVVFTTLFTNLKARLVGPFSLEEEIMLVKDDLDKVVCHHGCDDNTLFLHAKCHLDLNPIITFFEGKDALLISCLICQKEVAQVKIPKPAAKTRVVADACPGCDTEYPPQVSYEHGSGKLIVSCCKCQRLVEEIEVATK